MQCNHSQRGYYKINVLANTSLRQNDAIVEIRKLMLASYSAIYTVFQQRNTKCFYCNMKWLRFAMFNNTIARIILSKLITEIREIVRTKQRFVSHYIARCAASSSG